jgi:hypothetical protein
MIPSTLILSINAAGRLSLWDNAGQADRGKEDNEVVARLTLTPDQRAALEILRQDALALEREDDQPSYSEQGGLR